MVDRLEQLMKFYEMDPEDTFCTYGIAMEYRKEANNDEALDWINKTLDLDPNYAYAWYQKACILFDTRQPDDAKAAIESGIKAGQVSNDGKAVSELKDLLHKVGGLV